VPPSGIQGRLLWVAAVGFAAVQVRPGRGGGACAGSSGGKTADHLEHDDTDSSNPAEISKVAPVTVKIGEGRGNLRRREEWFQRR